MVLLMIDFPITVVTAGLLFALPIPMEWRAWPALLVVEGVIGSLWWFWMVRVVDNGLSSGPRLRLFRRGADGSTESRA